MTITDHSYHRGRALRRLVRLLRPGGARGDRECAAGGAAIPDYYLRIAILVIIIHYY